MPPRRSIRRGPRGQGGIRTPAVDAPIATLSGLPPAGAPGFCVLFGQTHPFTPNQISTLYPTHQDFVRAWREAVQKDLGAGYLLPQDAVQTPGRRLVGPNGRLTLPPGNVVTPLTWRARLGPRLRSGRDETPAP